LNDGSGFPHAEINRHTTGGVIIPRLNILGILA
jgi:hypothetical protein